MIDKRNLCLPRHVKRRSAVKAVKPSLHYGKSFKKVT